MERGEDFRSEVLMDFRWVVLGPVVTFVGGSRAPVNAKLILSFAIPQPMEFHVHGFRGFWLDLVVDDAMWCGVVGLDWGGWLGMAHFFQEVALRDCVFRIDEQTANFGFCCGGEDCLDDR